MPTLLFTVAVADHPQPARSRSASASAAALVLLVVRLVQRSTVQFVRQRAGRHRHRLVLRPCRRQPRRRAPTTRRWPTSCPASSTTPATPWCFGLTCLVGWPLVGFMVGSVTGDPTAWHEDRQVVRLCTPADLAAGAAVRASGWSCRRPIWLAGHSGAIDADTAVAALGVLKIVMGWPLQLAALGRDGLAARPATAPRSQGVRPPVRPDRSVRGEPPSGPSSSLQLGPRRRPRPTNSSSSPASIGCSPSGA